MLRHSLLVTVNVLAFATIACAQTVGVGQRPTAPTIYWGQSSTLQEGVQHGYADVLRADGSRTYDLSLAAGNFEDAREKALSNSKLTVNTYFQRRMLNDSYRRAMNGKSAAKTVAPAKVTRPTAQASPAPVSTDGRIAWPAALQGPAAGDSGRQLQRVFHLRASGQSVALGTPEYRQACQALSEITAELQGSIRTLPTAEYLAAKQVLKSLKNELAQPAAEQIVSQK